jgi:hypothetical protein
MVTKFGDLKRRYDGAQRTHGAEKAEWQSGKRVFNVCLGNSPVQERDDLVGTQPTHLAELAGIPCLLGLVTSLYGGRLMLIGFLPGGWACRVRWGRVIHRGRVRIILTSCNISCRGVAGSDIAK